MMQVVVDNVFNSAGAFVQGAKNFPCISSTALSLKIDQLGPALLALNNPDNKQQPSSALDQAQPVFSQQIVQSVTKVVLTFLALDALHKPFLYVNGAVGMGKFALTILTLPVNRKDAQDLLEESVFHALVAVTDYALGNIFWARVALAFASGVFLQQTGELFEKIYKPWKGAIQHTSDDTEEQNKERAEAPLLNRMADVVQCALLPNQGASRLGAIYTAWTGKKLEESRKD